MLMIDGTASTIKPKPVWARPIPVMSPKRLTTFLDKIDVTDDCWIWTGRPVGGGYGQFKIGKHAFRVHRVSYTLFVGEIPEGLVVDHLCRNRMCVRPDHLAAVTQQVNSWRGENCMRGICRQGHELTEDNVYRYGSRDGYIQTVCKTCKNAKRAAKRAAR